MHYEKDGDEVVQHRSQPDVVTLPDYEILQVSIITNFYIKYTIDFNFIYDYYHKSYNYFQEREKIKKSVLIIWLTLKSLSYIYLCVVYV